MAAKDKTARLANIHITHMSATLANTLGRRLHMLRRYCLIALLLLAVPDIVRAGYLDETPDEVFSDVYDRLGALPLRAARDPYVWLRLEELKREQCDQKSIADLARALDKFGYRREAANGLYNFVRNCGAPLSALHQSVDIYLKLTDYAKAVEVADEFMRRAPSDHNAHYLRGVALQGAGDFRRALVDYSNAIELFGLNKKGISSRVFLHMSEVYAALNQFCEAAAPISMWVSLDPASRDTSRTQKMISDYEGKGNCATSREFQKESYPPRGQTNVVTVKAEINGMRGLFILDTGASYVTVKSAFADRAKIPQTETEITLMTANGQARAKLSKADKVMLGTLSAANVPVAIQKADDKSYGNGVDGLLGMSFLSRFEVKMVGGSIEVSTRRPKK
jgi:clan AA aspartic protease (TIGR02281 family)